MILIARGTSFMLATPGFLGGASANMRAHGAAVSSFAGDTVYERQTTADHGTLRMMVRTVFRGLVP